MSELKKCPFCGVNEWRYQMFFSGDTIYQCDKCGTIVDESVINTRPIEDALQAENEWLKEELQQEKTRSQLNLEAEERRMLNITYYCAEIDRLNARIAKLEAEVTKCHELQDSYCDRIAELEAAQRWIRTKVKLPDRAVRQFYEVVCLHQDFAELALFSKGRWIIYDGTSVYDITDRVVFWRRRQPLPAEVMDVLNKRQELQ